MKLAPYFLLCLFLAWADSGMAQGAGDRRPGSSSSRNNGGSADRDKKPGGLRTLFGNGRQADPAAPRAVSPEVAGDGTEALPAGTPVPPADPSGVGLPTNLPAAAVPALEAVRGAVESSPQAKAALERARSEPSALGQVQAAVADPKTREAVEKVAADPQARTVLEKAVANPETMALIEKATEAVKGAMAGAPDNASGAAAAAAAMPADLKEQGARILGSLAGSEAGGAMDLAKALPKVTAALPQVSQALQAGQGKTKPAAAPPGTADPGMRILPDGSAVPPPTDILPNRIPRPELDASTPPTRITAESSSFDTKSNLVTFEGNVELDHPEFDMTCDMLVAELNAAPQEKNGKAAGSAAGPQGTVSGIRTATASGYVVIEKLTPEGGRQVAKSRKTVYEASTGIVTLSDFPVLDDGKNLVRGKEASTKILLSPDGKYKVDGPAIYELVTPDNQLKPGRPRQGGATAAATGGALTGN